MSEYDKVEKQEAGHTGEPKTEVQSATNEPLISEDTPASEIELETNAEAPHQPFEAPTAEQVETATTTDHPGTVYLGDKQRADLESYRAGVEDRDPDFSDIPDNAVRYAGYEVKSTPENDLGPDDGAEVILHGATIDGNRVKANTERDVNAAEQYAEDNDLNVVPAVNVAGSEDEELQYNSIPEPPKVSGPESANTEYENQQIRESESDTKLGQTPDKDETDDVTDEGDEPLFDLSKDSNA